MRQATFVVFASFVIETFSFCWKKLFKKRKKKMRNECVFAVLCLIVSDRNEDPTRSCFDDDDDVVHVQKKRDVYKYKLRNYG